MSLPPPPPAASRREGVGVEGVEVEEAKHRKLNNPIDKTKVLLFFAKCVLNVGVCPPETSTFCIPLPKYKNVNVFVIFITETIAKTVIWHCTIHEATNVLAKRIEKKHGTAKEQILLDVTRVGVYTCEKLRCRKVVAKNFDGRVGNKIFQKKHGGSLWQSH